jgi:two-component system, LytTR family, sensor kinase
VHRPTPRATSARPPEGTPTIERGSADAPLIRWATYWQVTVGVGATLLLFILLRAYMTRLVIGGEPITLMALAQRQAPSWIAWALLLPLVVLMCKHLPIRSGRDARRIAMHVLAFVVFQALLGIVSTFAAGLLRPRAAPPFSVLRATLRADPILALVLYGSVTTILHLIRYAALLRDREAAVADAARAEALLRRRVAEAQLESLQRQLQPHFLFNTLNTISAHVTREPAVARQLLTRLGGLLRQVLAKHRQPVVPLAEELAFLEEYLALQQARFREALVTSVRADPTALRAAVPWMILQPIVENAIAHGRSEDGVCRIAVTVLATQGQLVMAVSDEGPGFDPTMLGAAARSELARGIGLRNTRERLESLYGDGASFHIENVPGAGARVTLRIPSVPFSASGSGSARE